ncbi:MAG: helix-turn-helix transcriptional regulator [Firmicutes bacterium]|nr:helix-turn-helix transcriptional regulator [Bacillota bacterium]
MIHAYDKMYLEKARTALGRMMDFAVQDLGYDGDDFMKLFLGSGIAVRFGTGDVSLIAGRSGVELAYEVLEQSGIAYERIAPNYASDRSPEYWAGWALAYFQWESGMGFSEILRQVSFSEILELYAPYHEMDIRHFAETMRERYRQSVPETRLKALRQRAALSQGQLAELSGIPKRTIQQYEQRQKNINKAQAAYLVSLSDVLCCEVRELMEPYGEER